MLGFLAIVYLIQKHDNWTVKTLASALPTPVKSVHNLMHPSAEASKMMIRLHRMPAIQVIPMKTAFYPYINAQITPFFLNGRSQFFDDEISADRTKCRLRYGSEAFFTRVTNQTSLKDRIARGFFRHLHQINDWAHGAANFCQPFYIPGRDDYFEEEREIREKKRKRKE